MEEVMAYNDQVIQDLQKEVKELKAKIEEKFSGSREIAKALVKFQATCPEIPLDKEANYRTSKGSIEYKYASLGSILRTIKEPLKDSGLAISHNVTDSGVVCILMHESGAFMQSNPVKILYDPSRPQTVGMALTYARRYSLSMVLGISAETDKDVEGISGDDPVQPTEVPSKPEKPKADKRAMTAALARIKRGEQGIIAKMQKIYEISKDQIKQLEDAASQADDDSDKED